MKYFIVAYSHRTGFGSMGALAKIYPNKKQIKVDVEKAGAIDISIINIMEVTEKELDKFFEE